MPRPRIQKLKVQSQALLFYPLLYIYFFLPFISPLCTHRTYLYINALLFRKRPRSSVTVALRPLCIPCVCVCPTVFFYWQTAVAPLRFSRRGFASRNKELAYTYTYTQLLLLLLLPKIRVAETNQFTLPLSLSLSLSIFGGRAGAPDCFPTSAGARESENYTTEGLRSLRARCGPRVREGEKKGRKRVKMKRHSRRFQNVGI